MGDKRDIFSGIPKDSIVINSDNVSEKTYAKYLPIITNRNNWHGFLIHNVKNPNRNLILKIILDHVYPEALLPILFQSKGADCIFLSRNCSGAIDVLLKNKLIIPDPLDETLTYSCEIILMYSTITKLPLPPNNISKVLSAIYEENTKTLNLDNFAGNKELSEYTPLSQPKLLCFALHISSEMKPQFIKLKNNEIRTLSPFEILRGIGTVQRLDLRNNLITDIEELKYLKVFELIELWLDGNPLCEKYNEFSYVKAVEEILPTLKILDGISIDTLPLSQQYFICNDEGFDLVDQFIRHFFSLYDTNRKLLVDLYHTSAIFSMTVENKGNERLHLYRGLDRNCMNFNNSANTVAIGNGKIISILCMLPETKHNMQDFSVDLIHYKDTSAVISVTGTFFEDAKQKFAYNYLYSFKRTFTLVKHLSEYVICNEITYIGISSDLSMANYLSSEYSGVTSVLKNNEKKFALEAVSSLTKFDKTWIERLLEDADYNIIQFLTTLIELTKGHKIPEQAYSRNKISLMEWLAPKMVQFGIEKFESSLRKEALEYMEKSSHPQNIVTLVNQQKSLIPAKSQQICRLNNSKNNLIEIIRSNIIEVKTEKEEKNTLNNMKIIPQKNNISNNIEVCLMQNDGNQNSSKEVTDKEMKCKQLSNTSDVGITSSKPNENTESDVSESVQNNKTENITIYSTNDKNHITEQFNSSSDNVNYTNGENNRIETPKNEICEYKTRPILALVDSKWINIQEHIEYDFNLVFNKWILVQKGKDGKHSSKQDDFLKNLSCWKKHFPTYPDEILPHTLSSFCLHPKFDMKFDSIHFPVTHWDFPASVPHNIRPPQYVICNEHLKKVVTRGCGYGFVSVENNWVIVKKNKLGQWVTRNNLMKVVWDGQRWFMKSFTLEEKHTGIALANSKTNEVRLSSKEDMNLETQKEEKQDLLICDDKDLEIPSEDLHLTEKLQLAELKTIYAEDVETEATITTADLKLNFLTQKTAGETLDNWKKLFKLYPYVPKLALINGLWIEVNKKSDMKFQKNDKNEWILLEKSPESKKWSIINDDFGPNLKEKTKKVGKLIFNHIPFPVTMYDFPDSVPLYLRPPRTIYINGKEVEITPDSGYAFVSVGTKWIPVVRNKGNRWNALRLRNNFDVQKAFANMPFKMMNKTIIEIKCEDVAKISSSKCSLFQLIVGCKQLKPLTYWDMRGPEDKRPPKLAITYMNGQQRWSCVSPKCGKGFVLEDGVWVKVVSSESGEWKATQFDSHQGCIVGYCLYGNRWVIMKKYIIGGRWAPMFDMKTTPTTYWNYIGSDELKPPQQICIDNTYRTIHNNTEMGFVIKENAWILMNRKGDTWEIFKNINRFYIYKLVDGIWRTIEEDSQGRWSYKPIQQTFFTYMNFIGLNAFAPPKQINVLKGEKRIRKMINEESEMGFVLSEGVWVVVRLKDGDLIPMKNLQGSTDFGFKRVGEKFVVVRKDAGRWIQPKINQVKKDSTQCAVKRIFGNFSPVTYHNISIVAPEQLKPPKYAFIKDFIKNKESWRLIDQNSGYGFIRENDTWLLMKWTSDGNWKELIDVTEYRYKIINNMWLPIKFENNKWVTVFNPRSFPKIPELCVESPENHLPDRITKTSNDRKSKFNVTPSNNLGYLKILGEYVLVARTSSGALVWPNGFSKNFVFKHNELGEWSMCKPSVELMTSKSEVETQENKKLDGIKTYGNTEGSDLMRPPRYIKMMSEGVLKWREIDISMGFAFIKKEHWILVQKLEDKWAIVDENEGYAIKDNRWVLMKKKCNEWSPNFDPVMTPRTALDSVGEYLPPIRVATCRQGKEGLLTYKYINTANHSKYAFKVEPKNVYILTENSSSNVWENMSDNFPESHVMAYKLIDCKWRRMKKDAKKEWIVCDTQIDLPVLHTDVIGDGCPKPPSHISIPLSDKVHEMSFDIYSDDGFELDDGYWVLKKALKDSFDKYRGIFGNYGFRVVGGETYVYKKLDGVWTELVTPDLLSVIPISNPVTYRDFQNWEEKMKPPTDMLLLLHGEHKLGANECTCPYGFVKYKDVWVIVEENDEKWEIRRTPDMCYGYRLIGNRWVTMRLQNNKEWCQIQSPIPKAQKYLDTFGKFEDRPPLRAYVGENNWRLILDDDPSAFIKENDMWIHVIKSKNNSDWIPFRFNDFEKIGYKIIDGKWTCFTKTISEWKKLNSLQLPLLACDFTPGHKSAPPNSLKSVYPTHLKKLIRQIDVGPSSGKGFMHDNGAWVLMERQNKSWKRFASPPWIEIYHAFMLTDGVWKTVKKDLDGSWKSISLNGNNWCDDQKPVPIPKDPVEMVKIRQLHPSEKPPLDIVLFENTIPRKVSLKSSSVRNYYGFERHNDVWVLLKSNTNKKWDIAGTLVAYKRFKSRWVNMKFDEDWVPLYDPLTTPITYFEVAGLDAPPLRVAINENGIDEWKVIYQNSGYGFAKEYDIYILMQKQCDGSWIRHRDYFLEFTGYKMINDKWTRFKKNDTDEWTLKESSLPVLLNDFAKHHRPIPPRFFNKDFLMNPQKRIKDSLVIDLDNYSKFGYELRGDVWVLMEYDSGDWKEYKFSLEQTDLVGYRFGQCWKLLKLMNNTWVEGEFEFAEGNRVIFVETSGTQSGEFTFKREQQSVNELEVSNISGRNEQVPNVCDNKIKIEDEVTNQMKTVEDDKSNSQNIKNCDGIREDLTKASVIEVCDDNNQKAEESQVVMQKENVIDVETELKNKTLKENIVNSEINQGIKRKRLHSEKENEDIREEVSHIDHIDTNEKEVTIPCGDKPENEKKEFVEKNSIDIVKETVEETITEIQTETQNVTGIKQETGEENGRADDTVKVEKKPYEIPITSPVSYYQLADLPIEERPPRSVCLNVRGAPKRIPLVSKTSKIGFQFHNGVWVLLEKLSGVWKILHNSSGYPLAYKLMDNRWVNMRLDESGSWIPTFNPTSTPRTYFESEGPDDTKPPRRIVLEEDGKLAWKEISEISGFGFNKKGNLWLLMKKNPNNKWIVYKNNDGVNCSFTVKNSKWIRLTKRMGENWKIKDETSPVIHYDYIGDSSLAPPVLTDSIQKKIGKELIEVGFLKDDAAWVLMYRDEGRSWTRVPCGEIIYGFMRSVGELWDVVVKEQDQWRTVKTNCKFETAFDEIYFSKVKRKIECDRGTPFKRVKIEPVSPSLCSHVNIKEEPMDVPTENSSEECNGEHSELTNQKSEEYQTEKTLDHQTKETLHLSNVQGPASEPVEKSPVVETIKNLNKTPQQDSQHPGPHVHIEKISDDMMDDKTLINKPRENGPTSSLKTLKNNEPETLTSVKCPEMENNEILNSSASPYKNEKTPEEKPTVSLSTNIPQMEEELNSVEKYLLLKPDCCLGCPELQALLRQFRPSDNPSKILRKSFRLPGGGMRLLSIPKAATPKKTQGTPKKRQRKSVKAVVAKKRKIDK